MKVLLKHIVRGFINHRRQQGLAVAARRLCHATRALLFPRRHNRLFALELYRRYLVEQRGINGLVHFNLPHYLSTRLTLRQRARAPAVHYRYESARHDVAYQQAVYWGNGLTLWSTRVGDVEYSIRLLANKADVDRCEGALRVALFVGSVSVTRLSFSWVDSRVFGINMGVIPFVAGNQSVEKESADLQLFRLSFPQNSPAYFCIAALRGIAEAHDVGALAAVRHDCQISYREPLAAGFRHSYCDFWESVGGVGLDAQAYLLPVALAAPPLSAVKANHRGRASFRRRHWSDIAKCARESVLMHRAPQHSAEEWARSSTEGSGL